MSHNLHRRRQLFLMVAALFAVAAWSYSAAKKLPPERLIDLNVANVKELAELPGVGPTTAQAIIKFRQKSGPFRRVEDLLVIRGISEAKLKKLRPYVVIPPPARSAVVPARKPAPPATRPAGAPNNANKSAPAATHTPAPATATAPAKKP